tara:strand:- start:2911 stop:4134 length:1224 start_codon:yes stop_codon:yes gene_type:complete
LSHHEVIILGAGPAGLGVAASLEGWHPYDNHGKNLITMDTKSLLGSGIRPIVHFRDLHHPEDNTLYGSNRFNFRKNNRVDWIILSDDAAGGLWNNVPSNQLTLGPANWMELSHYPMKQFNYDNHTNINLREIINKNNLLSYYKKFSKKLNLDHHIYNEHKIISIEKKQNSNFIICSKYKDIKKEYSCKYLVFALGPKSIKRKLGVPGENFDYINNSYTKPEDFEGKNITIVGGGRSSDWAAQELFDKGKNITYIMRQKEENHSRLIQESQFLDYYKRWHEIISNKKKNMTLLYESKVIRFSKNNQITYENNLKQQTIKSDHVIIEIGGLPNYDLLKNINLEFHEKYDNYRFQLLQMKVHQHSFESINVSNLYAGGYLAQGTGLSVIGFHAGSFLISGDIIKKIYANN